MVLQMTSGRRFHMEETRKLLLLLLGPITVKDLDLTIVVLAQGTKTSCLSKGSRGHSDEEGGDLIESQRYL